MKHAVIAGYVRSPFHFAHKGALVEKRPDDLAAEVVSGLLDQTGVDPTEIEDLIVGCAFPEGEQGFNLGRIVGLVADLPISIGGTTVNRFCGSSMQAIHMAAGAIRMEAGEASSARRRVDEPDTDGRLQPGAQPGPLRTQRRRLYVDGRDRREPRPEVPDHP